MSSRHHHIAGGPRPEFAPTAGRPGDGVFERFLADHYPMLVQFLRRRTASEQDAEDAAQESLARLLRYRDTVPPADWKPLLFRIASNAAHDQSRQARTQHRSAHVPLQEDGPGPGQEWQLSADAAAPDRQLADRQQLELALAAIAGLPDKCRHVFLLSRFHGMSNHAIAHRCGISVRMVEKQISKALAACRSRVRDYRA